MTLRFLLLPALLFAGYVGSAQSGDRQPPTPTLKSGVLKKLAPASGVRDLTLPMTDGRDWPVIVSIPEGEGPFPLVMALHWAGGGSTYREFAECLALPGMDSLRAIVIAPSAEGTHWVTPENERRVIDLVRQARKRWPVDGEKIILTGYSNGGIGSWLFAAKYPKLFRAAIPLAGSYDPRRVDVPLYVLHGEKDELFPVADARMNLDLARGKGGRIHWTVVPNLSHYQACSYVTALRGAVAKMMKDWTTPQE